MHAPSRYRIAERECAERNRVGFVQWYLSISLALSLSLSLHDIPTNGLAPTLPPNHPPSHPPSLAPSTLPRSPTLRPLLSRSSLPCQEPAPPLGSTSADSHTPPLAVAAIMPARPACRPRVAHAPLPSRCAGLSLPPWGEGESPPRPCPTRTPNPRAAVRALKFHQHLTAFRATRPLLDASDSTTTRCERFDHHSMRAI